MSTGTIKFFNASKGFGFVTPDGGTADVFLPAAAITGAGLTTIKPGQRISFEQAPDAKGPKVVSLKLVGEAPAKPALPAAQRVSVYCDGNADEIAEIAETARDLGFALTMQDYTATPPGLDQLKRLSQLLTLSGQSLVRRHDPLFLALQLDDRFITDQDFWTAIAEHPTLINGPVLQTADRARICRTADEARAFLNQGEAKAASKPKTLSPRLAALLRGEALPPIEPAAPVPVPAPAPAEKKTEKKAGAPAKPQAKPQAKDKPAAKPKGKTAAKLAPAKAPAKKPAAKKPAKPAKKAKTRK